MSKKVYILTPHRSPNSLRPLPCLNTTSETVAMNHVRKYIRGAKKLSDKRWGNEKEYYNIEQIKMGVQW